LYEKQKQQKEILGGGTGRAKLLTSGRYIFVSESVHRIFIPEI